MRVSRKAGMTCFKAVEVWELHVERCAKRCRVNNAVETGMALRNRLQRRHDVLGPPGEKAAGLYRVLDRRDLTLPMSSGSFVNSIAPVPSRHK